MKKILIAGALALATAVPCATLAEYPEKPVEFIVPCPPATPKMF